MKKKIIICGIIAIVIVIGIIITAVKGLNISMQYSAHKQIDIPIEHEFNNDDIYSITKEVVEGDVIIQKVELYEDMASIGVKDISDEQLETLISKINEKYGINNDRDDLEVSEIPSIKLYDLVKPYITPIIISFVLIFVYITIYSIISKKTDKNTSVLKTICGTIITILAIQLLYLAVLTIVRIPINQLTIPIGIIIYAITTIGIMEYLKTKYKKIEK